jgi:hypothetical protein
MREISEEQVQQLEKFHGSGMVVVLSVGDDDFAFRRLRQVDVDLVLEGLAAQQYAAHEQMAVNSALCVEAPAAGQSPELDKTLPKEQQEAIVSERMRLAGLFSQANLLRDWVGMGLAQACGFGAQVQCDPQPGDVYKITASSASDEKSVAGDTWTLSVSARKLTAKEYAEVRRLRMVGSEGASERYAWKQAVSGPNKDEVARLYPYAVIGIGRSIDTLGAEGFGKGVRVKKFKAGSQDPPGTSGEQPASAETWQ